MKIHLGLGARPESLANSIIDGYATVDLLASRQELESINIREHVQSKDMLQNTSRLSSRYQYENFVHARFEMEILPVHSQYRVGYTLA